MQSLSLVIRDIQQATPLVRIYALESADGAPLPAFEPGAHIKVHIPSLNEPRCYSLIATGVQPSVFTSPRSYRLGVRLDESGNGGSRYMHSLKVGDTLNVEGPQNDFALHDGTDSAPIGKPVVLIAGGIGITPIASMATALAQARRSFTLHYCARSREHLALIDELQVLAPDRLRVHVDDEPDCVLDIPTLMDTYGPDQHVYVCGPKAMIDAVIAAASQRKWPDHRVHFELFSAASPRVGDQAFEVELKQSGKVLTIPPDKTIVEVMEAAGCDPLVDCKRGECGVCQTTVLEGTPDHRDYYLSASEKEQGTLMQICVSRAKSARLVLDL